MNKDEKIKELDLALDDLLVKYVKLGMDYIKLKLQKGRQNKKIKKLKARIKLLESE